MSMNILEAAEAAGLGGTIQRYAWDRDHFLVVRDLTEKPNDKASLQVVECDGDGFGNWTPGDGDLEGTDWYVLARSHRRIQTSGKVTS